MKAPHKTDFGQASEAAYGFNDLQQNRTSFGKNKLIFNYYNINFSKGSIFQFSGAAYVSRFKKTCSKTLIHSATKQATVCMSETLNHLLIHFIQKHGFIQQWNRREAIAWSFSIFVAAKNTQIKCMNCKLLNIDQL